MTHLFSWYPTLSSFLSSLLSRPYSSVFLFEIYPDVCHTDKLENRPKRLTHVSNGAKLPHWYSRIRTAWSYDRYVHRFRRERPARETMGINSIRKSRDRGIDELEKVYLRFLSSVEMILWCSVSLCVTCRNPLTKATNSKHIIDRINHSTRLQEHLYYAGSSLRNF